MLLLKFGKKEHLEQLKTGIVHFSPLASFIGDETKYRGDRLEGHLLADPTAPFLINGFDFAPYVQEATLSFVGVESILSFSASIVNYKNCHLIDDDIFTFNEDFVDEMEQFGGHALLIQGEDLLRHLKEKLKEYDCNCEWHPVFYCDKANHAAIHHYLVNKENPDGPYDYCFIKDATPYQKQNEWRFIIHDFENHLAAKNSGGVNVGTEFCTEIPIFETHSLKTAKISRRFLE